MLLTPVPLGDWGEVEMNLSRALDGMVGRATVQGFADLANGLVLRHTALLHRAPLEVALASDPKNGLAGRIAAWLPPAKAILRRDPTPRRPSLLKENLDLMSDAERVSLQRLLPQHQYQLHTQ